MHRRGFAALALGALPFLAGCGGTSSNEAVATATNAAPTQSQATSTAGTTPAGGAAARCRPAGTDGNGGPYPAPSSADCTGLQAVEVDVVSDPKLTGGFSPSNITISKGATVTWVWKSGGHNLDPFHDGIEDTGFTFSKRFDAAGTFNYQCQVHPGQNGVVRVE